jgi:hypothetical protein
MYMADSLGGFIGVVILIPLLIYFKLHNKTLLSIVLGLFSIFLIITFFSSDLLELYEQRDVSASTREENFFATVKNLSSLILNYPLGLPLTENTEQAQQNAAYSGSNFTPGNAFNLGGILSFVGYLVILFISLLYALSSLIRKDLTLDEQAAVVSILCLIPFIFQREVVWDCSVFALLISPFVISFLQYSRRTYRTTQPNPTKPINHNV